MAQNITITCGECSHQNEPERVYCHNCGAKLDRSLLPKPEDKKNFETADQKRQRVTKMMNIQGNWVKRDLIALVKVLTFAAVVAALLLFWLPPEEKPDVKDEAGDFTLRDEWQRQMDTAGATRWDYKEADANRFIKTFKGISSSAIGISYKASSVKFSPGKVTVFIERDAWGFASLWSSVDFAPKIKNGKFVPEVIGVHFGRLGVPPAMEFSHDLAAGAVLQALKKEFNLERIASATVEEGVLSLTTNPKATP